MTPITLNLLASHNPLEHVVDHAWSMLPAFGPFSSGLLIFSNAIFMALIAGGLTHLTLSYAGRRAEELRGKPPTGFYNFVEMVLDFLRTEVVKPVLGAETDKFIGFIWTAFVFILYCNLLGLVPIKEVTGLIYLLIMGLLFGSWSPSWLTAGIGGTATGSIWVTAGLAACSFVLFVGAGIRYNGLRGFLLHLTGGVPISLPMVPILLIMIPVEVIGLVVKPTALAIRLFANMTAGHILLAVLYGFGASAFESLSLAGAVPITLVSAAGALAIMALELFVAWLQAYIFIFLTTLFIGQMIEHHDEEEHEHDHVPENLSESVHGLEVGESPGFYPGQPHDHKAAPSMH